MYQEPTYTALLADSLGQRAHGPGGPQYTVAVPKLVRVAPGVYAAHAGTLQPAIDMLSAFSGILETAADWEQMTLQMQGIGERIYDVYRERFATNSFDVRIALVVTGSRRHPLDIENEVSSSIVLWEVARGFIPERVSGRLYFAGSLPMTEMVTAFLGLPLVAGMLKQGPLAASHALVAAHAAISKLSSTVSPDANVVVIGEDDEHTVLHGTLLELAQAELIKG
jgi:hypothetical protein